MWKGIRDTVVIYALVGLCVLGAIYHNASQASEVQVGVGWSDYMDDHVSNPTIRLTFSPESSDLYVYGAVTASEPRLYGQRMGTIILPELGLGFRHKLDKVTLFAEVGWIEPQLDVKQTIVQEVAYTYLVDRHHHPHRPIPVYPRNDYDQDNYTAVYDMEGDMSFGIGANYAMSERWGLQVQYKHFNSPTFIAIWDEERKARDEGWWQETINTDLSQFQLSVTYDF